MTTPPSQADPDAGPRVAELLKFGILDTAPESGFDDIVAIASELCQTPIALVSLLDQGRQWFKARTGVEVRETPISQAVCAHVLRAGMTLVIPDLTQDDRTRNNPLVTDDPRIRFYAGAPLITESGIPIGTVCVLDIVARPAGLTDGQRLALEALARQTMILLEMRRAVQVRTDALGDQYKASILAESRAMASEAMANRLQDIVERSRMAEEAGRIGTFEVVTATGAMSVSPEFCRIFGVPEAATHTAATFEGLVLPGDESIASTAQTRSSRSSSLDVEYRIRRANDGAVRWIGRRATFALDQDGQSRMFGAAQDITEFKDAQLRNEAHVELGDRLRELKATKEIAAVVGDVLGRTMGVVRAGFGTIDRAGQTLTIEQDWWDADRVVSVAGQYPFPVMQASMTVLALGRPLAVPDIASDDRLRDDAATYAATGAAAILAVPLLTGRELVGFVFVEHDKPRRWTAGEIAFVEGITALTQAAIARADAEQHQNLLNQELSHRLKNTLATVQAIAKQTLRAVSDRPQVEAFERRLQALSGAHDILLHVNWSSARISLVIDAALSALGVLDRIELSGPDIKLGARSTLSLTMLLHELATNALKYGALSTDAGKVQLNWTVERRDGAAILTMAWRESGGPATQEPARKGFGSRLINMGLSGTGGVSSRFTSSGLEVSLTSPLSKLGQ